jgi:hypothetical protein
LPNTHRTVEELTSRLTKHALQTWLVRSFDDETRSTHIDRV